MITPFFGPPANSMIRGESEYGVTAATGDVAESVRQKGLAHADRSHDQHVPPCLQKAQGGEFVQHRSIERDLGGVIPLLELGALFEARTLRAQGSRLAVSTRYLIAQDQEQEVLVRHFLLAGQGEPLGQGVENARELEPAEYGAQVR